MARALFAVSVALRAFRDVSVIVGGEVSGGLAGMVGSGGVRVMAVLVVILIGSALLSYLIATYLDHMIYLRDWQRGPFGSVGWKGCLVVVDPIFISTG